MTIGRYQMLMSEYHIAFTLKVSDPGHCVDCTERQEYRDRTMEHIRMALVGHDEVDLTTPDLRYITTVRQDSDGNLTRRDRYAEETPEPFTDPTDPRGRRYTRI